MDSILSQELINLEGCNSMKFTRTEISEVVTIEPTVHGDDRGYFVETFRQDKLEEFLGYKIDFCQDNESKSSKGVLRGLHYQLASAAQTKLVRVIQGRVLDVALLFVKFIFASITPSILCNAFSFNQTQAEQCIPSITSETLQNPSSSFFTN